MQFFAAVTVLVLLTAAPVQKVYGSSAQNGGEEAAQVKDGTGALSYEEAIDSFYRNSGIATDEQILADARGILSDTDVLYSELEADESGNAEEALSAYEKAKAEYLTASINDAGTAHTESTVTAGTLNPSDSAGVKARGASETSATPEQDAVCREWDRQAEYAQMMIAEGSVIREMIPRYQVTSCTKKDGVLILDVDEWMTQGYSADQETDVVNASAYSYTFTLTLTCSDHGVWTPSEINGTDINFTWLDEGEDPVTESQESPVSLFEVKSDLDAAPAAYAYIDADAAVPGAQEAEDGKGNTGGSPVLSYTIDEGAEVPSAGIRQAEETQDLTADTMYEHGSEQYAAASAGYTYKPAKAVAYADKYWKKYNRKYKEYRGVDCANFVSQCLYAGGMPKTSDWYPQSVNWINVMGHIRHFKAYGMFLTASDSNVLKGNPVYYDWNGNGTYDHVAICVGHNASGMPVVDAHTNNVYHVPWRMGSRGRRGTITLNKTGSSGTSVAGAKNTWQTVSGKVYYIGSDGKRVKSKFLNINGARYYFNSKGERVSGFFKVGSKRYYASVKSGQLLKGWQNIGGKVYYFYPKDYSRIKSGKHKIGKDTYYFNSKGVRQTGFIKSGSKWYYADKTTGKLAKGWKKISGKWYYFDKKTLVRATGWKTINGKKCYFDSKGVLKKGKHG